jgi:SAM-dependent methyltransferase
VTGWEPRAALACPDCGGGLEVSGPGLRCRRDGTPFPIERGIPLLFPSRRPAQAQVLAEEFTRWWTAAGPHHPRQRLRVHRAVARLAGPGRQRVACDVGAGSGSLAALLAAAGWSTYALDVDAAALGQAKRAGEGPFPVAGLLEAPPFQPGSLDLAVLCSSLQYASDAEAALGRWARCLRPGGRMLLALTPLHRGEAGARRGQEHARALMHRSGSTQWLARTYRHFTLPGLMAALGEAGLRPEVLRSPLSPAFLAWRAAKRAVLGDIARFPIVVGHREGPA